jgi:hypothetical protein
MTSSIPGALANVRRGASLGHHLLGRLQPPDLTRHRSPRQLSDVAKSNYCSISERPDVGSLTVVDFHVLVLFMSLTGGVSV